MNILMISNIDDDEKLEDIWLLRAFQKEGHQVILTGTDYDEKLEKIVDIVLKRNVWFSSKNEMSSYYKKVKLLNERIKRKNLSRINFDGKFDTLGKTYLVKLFQEGYPVMPTIDNLQDFDRLPNSNLYLLKPKFGIDGIGQIKLGKEQVKEKFEDKYVLQPVVKFQSEVQFYFINDEFQYALEFKPSKVPVYPKPQTYNYSENELKLAKKFAQLNQNFWGIQRIDFLKLENDELCLIEIEDDSPYLDLDCVEKKVREKFIEQYKNMVYEYQKFFA